MKQWQFVMRDSNSAMLLRDKLVRHHGFRTAEGYAYLHSTAYNTTFEVAHTDPEQLTLALLGIDTDTLLGVYEVGLT